MDLLKAKDMNPFPGAVPPYYSTPPVATSSGPLYPGDIMARVWDIENRLLDEFHNNKR